MGVGNGQARVNLKADSRRVDAARCLLLDHVAVEVTAALEREGMDALMLKGASFAGWLWRGELRPYGDLDLLVSPDDFDQAGGVLTGLGFVDPVAEARPSEAQRNGRPWVRTQDGVIVDLHRAIVGVRLDDRDAWDVLSAHRAPLAVGNATLWQLDEAARTMHVALHAAQHGAVERKPLADLSRAAEQIPLATWAAAVELARELDAMPAFAGGVRLVEPGRALARQLGLERELTLDVAMRLQSTSQVARGIARLAGMSGVASKVGFALDRIAPSPAFLRQWTPLARRGRMGLALAYLWRNIYLAAHLVPGIVAWRRAARLVKRTESLTPGSSPPPEG